MKHEEITALPEEVLFARAVRLTRRASGNHVELCAIINIRSGRCGMDCAFCLQNRHAGLVGHPMPGEADLIARIRALAALPVAHIGLVSSGAAMENADFSRLTRIICKLDQTTRSRLCVSLGRLDRDRMLILRRIGINHYHHNLETSQSFYPKICSTQTWAERAATVSRAIALGFEVCSGALFGMGESWSDRRDLALALAEMHVRNIPLNFLHPQPGTALGQRQPLAAAEGLRIIALFRHILPTAKLRVCGGRPLVFGARQQDIFRAGANALMTGDYLTTAGGAIADDLAMLKAAGLAIAETF